VKLVVAIIKPFKFDEVRSALSEIGVETATAAEVSGYGRQLGRNELDTDSAASLLPKIKFEILVEDDEAGAVIETLCHSAHTGRIGDGKIFVFDVIGDSAAI
jgi:nitrogen regulatory protein P-II 2